MKRLEQMMRRAARKGVEDEWNTHEVDAMNQMGESARWNTIAMYLELPYGEAEMWPQKVVGRLFKMWEVEGWLAVRDEMMRITIYSPLVVIEKSDAHRYDGEGNKIDE